MSPGKLAVAIAMVIEWAGFGRAADIFTYRGLSEASAAVTLDADHFAVASDESNRLMIYRIGSPEPISAEGYDPTDYDASDIEAAATVGGRTYWLSSHSFTESGEDKKKRRLFFATETADEGGTPALRLTGQIVSNLRDGFPPALLDRMAEINIEGLAAAPDETGLLIGFRAPLTAYGKARVLRLLNPAAVVNGAPPEFDAPIALDLGGQGIRSIDRLDLPDIVYLIVGGPVADNDGKIFTLYAWSGVAGDEPVPLKSDSIVGLKPEAAFRVPGTDRIVILIDDGNGKKAGADPTFRSVEIDAADLR